MQMGWAVVCLNVRPSEKKSECVREGEREREKEKQCASGEKLHQHNGQHLLFGVFIQNSELVQHQGTVDCQGFKN